MRKYVYCPSSPLLLPPLLLLPSLLLLLSLLHLPTRVGVVRLQLTLQKPREAVEVAEGPEKTEGAEEGMEGPKAVAE